MSVLPYYQGIRSTTNEDLCHVMDKMYWEKVEYPSIGQRSAKLVEETRELHEAVLEYELNAGDPMDELNEMMWELSDVFAVFRHIEVHLLDSFGLKRDQLDWLEQKLAGMAVYKAGKRAKDPHWGRKE